MTEDWPDVAEPGTGTVPLDDRQQLDEAALAWTPVDLGPYLRGEIIRPEPTLGIARNDGLRLVYPGKEHAVIGEMESGKSWFALACCAAEMADNRLVIYIHFEEADPSDTVERLRLLGCPDWQIQKLFRFVAPDRQVAAELLADLLYPAPSLVVFDGVNEAMSLHRWDIRDESGAADFRRHLVKPCTRAGAATMALDHVAKDVERRGRTALGSIHKVNGLSGALFRLDNADPYGRGERGRSHVYVMKDRPGFLRRHGERTKSTGHTFMGEFVIDDTQMYGPETYVAFYAPVPKDTTTEPAEPAGSADERTVLATVRTIIAKGQVANLRTIRALAPLGKDKVDSALVRLVLGDQLVETTGPNRARIFTPSVAEDQSSSEVS